MKPKILIIRFSSIGDIVLTTPVIRCLKQQLDADIGFVTKKAFRPVLEANPYISHIYTIEKSIYEVLPRLREAQFNLIVDLHNNIRSFQIKRGLGIISKAFNKLNWEKWLITNFKIDRLPDKHIVDRYLATVKHLEIAYDGRGLDYFIPPGAQLTQAAIAKLFGDLPVNKGYIAFAIGGAHATKRLPVNKIIELCRSVNHPILLVGGKDDEKVAGEVVRQCSENTRSACGLLSINQSASAVQQASVVVTHDTGMMHIAAAFNKPIVSIWGNTIPAFGMYPLYADGKEQGTIFEVEGLKCRPCSKIGYKACPKGHFNCMQQQSVKAISANIEQKWQLVIK